MEHYANVNVISGVYAFELGDSWIMIQFKDGSIYRYSYEKAGMGYVEKMKKLAKSGRGLNSYILLNCRFLHD